MKNSPLANEKLPLTNEKLPPPIIYCRYSLCAGLTRDLFAIANFLDQIYAPGVQYR